MSPTRIVVTCCLLSLLLPGGCGGEEENGGTEPETKRKPMHPALLDPSLADEQAPKSFQVRFETTEGAFTVECRRKWAPKGVDRFYNLVRIGYFDDVAFFRVVPEFVVQFGIHGRPAVNREWMENTFPDDPVVESNRRGTLTFAKTNQPNSRSVQLFVNLKDNTSLDGRGFAPIGRVTEGMEVLEKLYSGYGDDLTNLQGEIKAGGNAYLRRNYPELDYIEKARLVQ